MNFPQIKKKKQLNVPENLEKFLIELTVEILVNNPVDLNEFSYWYFKSIYERENKQLVEESTKTMTLSKSELCTKVATKEGKRVSIMPQPDEEEASSEKEGKKNV